MCCEADWKREIVPDHKFDFLNVREFHRTDILTRLKYVWKYILVLKSVAVYGLDIFTAITMIASDHWTNAIQSKCSDSDCGVVDVKFSIAKWIFVGCIIFSFLLLAYETYKAKKVIESRDISYAFTNLMANDYYSLKSYDIFCLFCHINSSAKRVDDFAFFIYFTFKDWKRLLLADGPRQSINALILFSFAYASGFQTSNLSEYYDGSPITAMLLLAMIATVLIFLGSLILLIVAAVFYVPFLCYIQGNLKEYVCHKVDKRISELIKRKQRDRIRKVAAMEKKMANGSYKGGKGDELAGGNFPQPTLPDVSLDDDDFALKRKLEAERSSARGVRRQKTEVVEYEVYGGAAPSFPPTMDYNSPYEANYDESSTNLAANAAPFGMSYPPAPPPPTKAPSYTSTTSRSYTPAPSGPTLAPGAPSFPPSRSQTELSGMSNKSGGSSNRYPPNSFSPPPNEYGYNQQRSYTRNSSGSAGSGGYGRNITGASGGRIYDEPESMPYMPPSQAMQNQYGYGSNSNLGSNSRRDPNAGRMGYR